VPVCLVMWMLLRWQSFRAKLSNILVERFSRQVCITLPISKETGPLERSHVLLKQRNNNFTFVPRSRAGSAPQHVLCILSIFCAATFRSQGQTYKALLGGNERTVGGGNKSESRLIEIIMHPNHRPTNSGHRRFMSYSKEYAKKITAVLKFP
jgi:hypothetical protein